MVFRTPFTTCLVLLLATHVVLRLQAPGENTPWSLRPLAKPSVPTLSANSPIDAFIDQALAKKELKPSPPADRSAWLRRVTFDLLGLPPGTADLKAFLADTSPQAEARVVDRLLASPRHGERWARHWMDAVRYAETHGHDEDAIRENAWPYRDWLIQAFNQDKPYQDFVREQIAGDVIAPENPSATVATAFLACGPWDSSSQMGIQDGTTDKKIAQYLDRDDMLSVTMSTFCSTTAHCARCHDHKFDPISLKDYYALQAVFAGIDRVDRPIDDDPAVAARRQHLLEEQRLLESHTYPESSLDDPNLLGEAEAHLGKALHQWHPLTPNEVTTTSGSALTVLADGSILFQGPAPDTDTYTIRSVAEKGRLTAIQLEVLSDPSLPGNGPGRAPNGNLHLSEVTIRLNGEPVKIQRAVADFNQSGWEIERALDGNPATAWGIHPEEGRAHRAVFVLAEPVDLEPSAHLEVVLEQLHGGSHLIGRPRLSITGNDGPAANAALPANINALLAIPKDERSQTDQRLLTAHYLIERNAQERAALPAQRFVYAVASSFNALGNFKSAGHPRDVQVLLRGDIHSPIEAAEPGALSCIPNLPGRFKLADPTDEGARRAALADWIASSDNVLTWRSIVNRVWHFHFGRGLVDTPNDFGTMGSHPTHPELLDYLALAFRDEGAGRLKWLHRAIVLSAAYQQSADDRPEGLAADPDNRFLWRMNRHRLDAESIHDSVLSLSEMLNLQMGGPSARQFHTSKGVHVTPIVDYENLDPDDPANFRRSVYRFVFRTVPDPFMQALDCPDASQLAARRETSTTALQALAMFNNRFIVRQSEHLAEALKSRHPSEPQAQIAELVFAAYGRPVDAEELAALTEYAGDYGLANACRVVINSSEFLSVH